MPFTTHDLASIDAAKEIRVETAMPDGPVHRTIIWVVVEGGEVFVRSWRGSTARWYREAVSNPEVAIHVGKRSGRRLPAIAVPAGDAESIRRTSAALERKYAGDPSTPSMVRAEILETTLRLDPRDDASDDGSGDGSRPATRVSGPSGLR